MEQTQRRFLLYNYKNKTLLLKSGPRGNASARIIKLSPYTWDPDAYCG